MRVFPGDSIRPVDPIVSDRIRVGFHRNPIWLLSDSTRPNRPGLPGFVIRW